MAKTKRWRGSTSRGLSTLVVLFFFIASVDAGQLRVYNDYNYMLNSIANVSYVNATHICFGLDCRSSWYTFDDAFLLTNASNQDSRIIALENVEPGAYDDVWAVNNISNLWVNASDQDGRVISLEGRALKPSIDASNVTSGNFVPGLMPSGWVNKTYSDILYPPNSHHHTPLQTFHQHYLYGKST